VINPIKVMLTPGEVEFVANDCGASVVIASLSHRNILLNVAMTALMHQRSEQDKVVNALPCPHVYGNVVMSGAAQNGMTLVLHPYQ
jgi:acyl-CoA synthetase (AMP-forming)/AMP-acid ligase II